MKFKKLLILAASTLMLTACGSLTAGKLPSGGKAATSLSAIDAVANAYTALVNVDSLAANVNLKKLHADVVVGGIDVDEDAEGNDISGTQYLKADASGKLSIAASGLTSTTLNDVKAAAELSNLSLSGEYYSIADGATEKCGLDISIPKVSGISAGAYLSEGYGYVDLSNANLRGAIKSVLVNLGMTEEVADAMIGSIPEKGKTAEQIIDEEDLPLIQSAVLNILEAEELPTQDDVKEALGSVMTVAWPYVSTYAEVVTYDKGGFGIAIDLSMDDIKNIATTVFSILEVPTITQGLIYNELDSVIDLKALKLSIVFDENYLLSDALVDIDISVDTTLGTNISTLLGDMSVKAALALKLEVGCSYGDSVKVVLPADLADYSVFGGEEELK